jgi:hypothetical protein
MEPTMPLGGDPLARLAVGERPVERHVAQRVDVAVRIAVVVEAHVVLGEAHRSRVGVAAGKHRHVVGGGVRVVRGGQGVQREAQADGAARSHQPGGRDDVGWGQMVQRAPLIGLAPASPGGDGREERGEVVGADVHILSVVGSSATGRWR